jgi:hypothetical protein
MRAAWLARKALHPHLHGEAVAPAAEPRGGTPQRMWGSLLILQTRGEWALRYGRDISSARTNLA